MGLFKKLWDTLDEDILSPGYKKGPKKVLKPVWEKAVSPVLDEYYNRVGRPFAYDVYLSYQNPETLFQVGRREKIARERGVRYNALGIPISNEENAEKMEQDMAKLPWYGRMALDIGSDPLTVGTLGWGSIARGGIQGGIRGALKATARELAGQTGIPQAGRMATLPYRMIKDPKLLELQEMGRLDQAVHELNIDGFNSLTDTDRATLLAKREALKGAISQASWRDMSEARKAWQELGETNRKIYGDNLVRGDVFHNIRRGKALSLVTQTVRPAEEYAGRFRHRVDDPRLLERVVDKVPALKQFWSAADPSTRAKISGGLLKPWVEYNATLSDMEHTDTLARTLLDLNARRAGLDATADTGELLKVRPKAGVEVPLGPRGAPLMEDVMKWGPQRYDLTPQQLDVWSGFHLAIRRRSQWAQEVLLKQPEIQEALKDNRSLREWINKLGTPEADGGMYVPRVAKYRSTTPEGAAAFEEPRLEKFLKKWPKALGGGLLSPYSDMPIAKGFERVRLVEYGKGAVQSIEHERELADMASAQRVVWNYNLGDILYGHSQQLSHIVADDTILTPALKKLGRTAQDIVGEDILAAVDKAGKKVMATDRAIGKVKAIYRHRSSTGRVIKEIRDLAKAPGTEGWDEYQVAVQRLEPALIEARDAFDELPPDVAATVRRTESAQNKAEDFVSKNAQRAQTKKPPRTPTHVVQFASNNTDDLAEVVAASRPKPGAPPREMAAEPEYFYHGTNQENLYSIAEDGKLQTFKPNHGTDQSVWPDKTKGKRAYFSEDPNIVHDIYPEGSPPALLRVRRDAPIKAARELSFTDWYTNRPVPAKYLEFLDEAGNWRPLSDLRNGGNNGMDVVQEALRRKAGPEHAAFKELSGAIDKNLGIEAAILDNVGDWQTGAENSITRLYKSTSPQEAAYLGALHVIAGDQQAVYTFIPKSGKAGMDAPDALYSFTVKGNDESTIARVRDTLDRHGIEFRSLADEGPDTRVMWIGQPGEDARVKAAAKELGTQKVTARRGVNIEVTRETAPGLVTDYERSVLRSGRGRYLTDPVLRERLNLGPTPLRPQEEELLRRVAAAHGASQEAMEGAQRLIQARRNLDDAASLAREELDGLRTQAVSGAEEAKRTRDQVLTASTVSQLRQVHGIPALTGTYFDNHLADKLEKYFGFAQGDLAGGAKVIAGAQAAWQSVLTGMDFSFAFLQSLAAAPANPVGWAKGLALSVGSWFDPDLYGRYLESLAKGTDAMSGKTWLEQMERAKLTMAGTELFQPTEALMAMGVARTPVTTAVEMIDRLPWNRAFAMGRNVAAAELFRAQVGLEGALRGRGLLDDELEGVARQVNLATGVVDNTRLGILPGQATSERLVGRLGVQWFRSQTGRVVQAFNLGQIDGTIARRLLFHQLAGMTALYVATAKLADGDPVLDPTDPHFLELKVGGQWIGFGGLYPSMMKTVAQTIEAAEKGEWGRFDDIKNGRNPLLNFWRNGAPVVGGLVADAVLKVNSDTRYGNSLDHPEETIIPFSVQAAMDTMQAPGQSPTDLAVGTLSSALGLKADPINAVDYHAELAHAAANKMGYAKWVDVPRALQDRLERDNPELAEAVRLKNEYYQQRGLSMTDVAFQQLDQSRNAMGDVMSAQWARVQNGELTKSEWRQMMSEWLNNHAYHTKNLFDAIPEKDRKKRDPTTIQDRLAEQYQAILPENFDADGDGQIEENEWDQWREAKRKFWEDRPEALDHRDYILYEYPTRVWSDPMMTAADTERRQAQATYDEFLQFPKYRGMSMEQARFVDMVRGMKSAAADEIRFALAQRGAPLDKIRVPARAAWGYALQLLQESGTPLPQDASGLIRLAIAMDKPKVRRNVWDPSRARFLLQNRQLLEWYPTTLTDAGLDEEMAARLGLLDAPMGESPQERIAAFAGG